MPNDHLGELLEDIPPTRSALLAERGYPPEVVAGARPELSDLPLRQQRARLRGELDVDDGEDGSDEVVPGSEIGNGVTDLGLRGEVMPRPEIRNGLADLGLSGANAPKPEPAPVVEASPDCSVCGGPIALERARLKAKTCDRLECQREQKRRREAVSKERRSAASSNGHAQPVALAPQTTNGVGAVPEPSGSHAASSGHTGALGQGQRPADIALPAHDGAPMAALAAELVSLAQRFPVARRLGAEGAGIRFAVRSAHERNRP